MKALTIAFAGCLLLATLCSGQEPSSAQEPNSNQNVVAAAKASRAQIQAQQVKQADIRRLLELTGAAGMASQSMDGLEKSIRSLMSDSLPPGDYRDQLVDLFFQKFRSKRDMTQLVDLVVPIYDKYYTDEEIKSLIQFYETPVARKMLAVLPKVLEESQAAGNKWGEELGRQSMTEVLAEHPELQAAQEDASKKSPQR
jgi:hypothetical protein